MRLCFGSYLAVLVSCKAVNVDNKVLCEALLHSVAPNYEFTFADQENPDRVREDASSKLLRCEQNLPKDVTTPARSANAQEVATYFNDKILPFISDSQFRHIILAIKDIIANDPPVTEGKRIFGITDETTIDHVGGITKGVLASKSRFSISEFLAGVFLFVATKTNNRSGKKTVRDVNNDYILSFTDRIDEIELISEDDEKKAAIISAAAKGKSDIEVSDEFAGALIDKISKLTLSDKEDKKLLVTLTSETDGKCLYCGKELGIPVRGKTPTANWEIVYVTLDVSEVHGYENAIALCETPCAAEVDLMSVNERNNLLDKKRHCAETKAFLDKISGYKFQKEIESVLREIHKIKNDTTLEKTDLKDLVEIEQKINEPLLKDKINLYMVRLYKTVKRVCGRLEQEINFDTEAFGGLMKAAQRLLTSDVVKNKGITDPQEYVVTLLTDRLFSQIGQQHKGACEIIIGYLVKRCDLFNENAKQG